MAFPGSRMRRRDGAVRSTFRAYRAVTSRAWWSPWARTCRRSWSAVGCWSTRRSTATTARTPPPVGLLGSEADGGFATYVAVPAAQAHDVTDSPLSDEELACLPVAYGTAMGMLERAEVRAGETVLVTGASGGVGLALVQLAAAGGRGSWP